MLSAINPSGISVHESISAHHMHDYHIVIFARHETSKPIAIANFHGHKLYDRFFHPTNFKFQCLALVKKSRLQYEPLIIS